ncbi:MAG: hypothetical protein K9H06_18790 [Melioribacteraceae bacterium]|nr:acyltransferase [Bacteroidales bacterium]MCF8298708.1 hypothetical protein [Saprospiraceae bacterium]MCF8395950.1 hypothetical protein [Melioribacteraceae bacterium]
MREINSFLTDEELKDKGFKRIGSNCKISRNAQFYGLDKMEIGNNVRIDDFCILSGKIILGSFIHISAFSALYGLNGIFIEDFSGLSPNSIIFSASDDFSGNYLINPMVPKEYTNVWGGKVILRKYVQLGANTIVMPDVVIEEGVVTGAFTFVNKSLAEWYMYTGIPAKAIKQRNKTLLNFIKNIL